jgi:nitroreductase
MSDSDPIIADNYSVEGAQYVDAAIASRKSARAFLPTPVPRALVEHILHVSSRAPSGTNMQPWKVYVMTGTALKRFSDALVDAYLNSSAEQHEREHNYYPSPFPEPYLSRRRKVGWDLYGLLNIAKGDKEKMKQQHAKNFRFFDAPVGMIITIDRVLEIGSWFDLGMFAENIMIAARGHGLHTCPQAAFAPFHRVIRLELNIPEEEVVVCGMAQGHIDPDAIENTLESERVTPGEFAWFIVE